MNTIQGPAINLDVPVGKSKVSPAGMVTAYIATDDAAGNFPSASW